MSQIEKSQMVEAGGDSVKEVVDVFNGKFRGQAMVIGAQIGDVIHGGAVPESRTNTRMHD